MNAKAGRNLNEVNLSLRDVLGLVAEAVSEKKGINPVFLDLRGVVDYLDVICVTSGETSIQNRAIADRVEERLRSYDIIPFSLQGYEDGSWILLDYETFVVHVMLPELRSFYQLEELWSEGRPVTA